MPLYKVSQYARRLYHSTSLVDPFRVLFLGRDEFSCLVLKELYAARDIWQTIDIATYPDAYTGRRRSVLSVSPLKSLAGSLDLPIHTIPPTKPGFKDWELPRPFSLYPSSESPPPNHHVLVTASFGRILSKRMLMHFAPLRKLNVHPSLLPAYRGPAPIQHTLMKGEQEAGVGVITMLPAGQGIDKGDVWGLRKLTVPKDIEFSALRDTLAKEGGELLVNVLRDMRVGKATCTRQLEPPVPPPTAPMITAELANVDFRMPAEAIVRLDRAIAHQRPLTTYLPAYKNTTVQLHGMSVVDGPLLGLGMAMYDKACRALLVGCGEGSVLCVPFVKQQGKALVGAGEWWNGAKGMGIVYRVGGGVDAVQFGGVSI